jgi:flavin-dependent dehydrogenase
MNESVVDRQIPLPVILGTGLTGVAISRSLSAQGIGHVLLGGRPTDMPRLGESLNPEGSLEIVRQFPGESRFFFRKRRQALFFGAHALSFDFPEFAEGPAYGALLGFPATISLLHVDRIGFDRAIFEAAVADSNCFYLEDQAAGLDCQPCTGRIEGVRLASGRTIAAAYVFDATNHVRFVARKLGIRRQVIGPPRRVVFAHYRLSRKPPANPPPETSTGERQAAPLPWLQTTALLRLIGKTDGVEGLAWCIPLGDYVSVGLSVDAGRVRTAPALLLDLVERAYARRGLDVRGGFPERGAPVDFPYEHYDHERCFGRNWLLAGPSCCQFWLPAAAGVATGLVAARLAPEVLRHPADAPVLYQDYIDRQAAGHSGLDWLVRDDPEAVTAATLRQRSEAMIQGNVRRLSRYLRLQAPPPEPAFGAALTRLYESDRRLANPARIDAAPPETQATRLFAAPCGPGGPAEEPVRIPVLARPEGLSAPEAVLGIVDLWSGKGDPARSDHLVTPNLEVRIDGFSLEGVASWRAWIAFLRGAGRVEGLELVPGSISAQDGPWVLTCQWQGTMSGRRLVSPPFTLAFRLADGRVSVIETRRADYAFVVGDFILPRVAFAAVLGRLTEKAAA